MNITLTKLGRNIKIEFDSTQTTQAPLFEDSANVEMSLNRLSLIVSISIKGGSNFSTDKIDNAIPSLYVNAAPGYDNDVISEANFDSAYAALFPKEGGGSGTTPNLQAVTAIGDNTNLQVTVYEEGNQPKHISMITQPGIKGGIIEFGHQDSFKVFVALNDYTPASDNYYLLPSKNGTDTFAMISDVPFGGLYAAAVTNTINGSFTRIFTHYGKTPSFDVFHFITVYFQFTGTSIGAAGKSSFEIQLPFSGIGKSSFGLSGAGTAILNDSENVPLFITQGSDQDHAKIELIASAPVSDFNISGCLHYGFFF